MPRRKARPPRKERINVETLSNNARKTAVVWGGEVYYLPTEKAGPLVWPHEMAADVNRPGLVEQAERMNKGGNDG